MENEGDETMATITFKIIISNRLLLQMMEIMTGMKVVNLLKNR
jgi:hypothetical protein